VIIKFAVITTYCPKRGNINSYCVGIARITFINYILNKHLLHSYEIERTIINSPLQNGKIQICDHKIYPFTLHLFQKLGIWSRSIKGRHFSQLPDCLWRACLAILQGADDECTSGHNECSSFFLPVVLCKKSFNQTYLLMNT
jgi:hypothetical protein